MTNLKEIISGKAEELFEELCQIRQHLHQHPELSFKEYETSKFIKEKLTSWGISVDRTWVETGFSCIIDSGKEGPCIALRADLDALPIQELNQVYYKSIHDGVMHACGHDFHATCLMGVGKLLNESKEAWKGKVVLVFQPGEEKLPGGASLMIKEGILDLYKPDCMFAQHVYPELPAGSAGFRPGMYMASADEIYIKVIGKGGHAALPHTTIDPIIVAANILVELQQISSRFSPPTLPTVLSFGKIEGLGATNVIPTEVKIEGTLRTFNEEWRAKFHHKIEQICKGIAAAHSATCEVDIKKGYPFLINDETLTLDSKNIAIEFLEAENVIDLDLRMTAEDFSFFSQKVPSCFFRIGVGNESKGITHGVHHPEFNIDEEALKYGVGLMSYLTIQKSLS